MTKMIKTLSLVVILITSSSVIAGEKSSSRLNQVRNSLWVFGVDNGVSEVPAAVEHIMMQEEHSESMEQSMVVPEELEMAIHMIDA